MSKKNLDTSLDTDAGKQPDVAQPGIRKKTVALVIHSQDGPGGKDDVAVGLNGRVWNIKRDKKVDVPMGVYNVLVDAIQTDCVQDDHGNITYTDRNRFAISTY
jgi:hypothetical protein